ncbi:MAG: hypothetical protein QG640_196 [Patescibacteria group bacterium]|nr:hypothetical protein [Patescibacteria group bacterium]
MKTKAFSNIIKKNGEVLAIVFQSKNRPDGLCFPTPLDYPLQIGWHTQKAQRTVPLHRHPDLKYNVVNSQEFLYVEKGKVSVKLTDKNWKLVKKINLEKGDSILITGGGHEVTIGKNTSILEVKQGPYPGDAYAKIYKK